MTPPKGPKLKPDLSDRILVALKREREAGAGVLSRGLGANVGSVSAALQRLLDAGRVVLVRTEGQARIYALVENADRRQGSR